MEQRDASGIRGLVRRSAFSGVPAGVLGLVVLVGLVASQGVTPSSGPPSMQQLSPADDGTDVRPAPAGRVRLQSPARAATQGARAVERRSEPVRRPAAPSASSRAAAPEPPAAVDEKEPDEPRTGDGDPVNGLEACVEQILVSPADVDC